MGFLGLRKIIKKARKKLKTTAYKEKVVIARFKIFMDRYFNCTVRQGKLTSRAGALVAINPGRQY